MGVGVGVGTGSAPAPGSAAACRARRRRRPDGGGTAEGGDGTAEDEDGTAGSGDGTAGTGDGTAEAGAVFAWGSPSGVPVTDRTGSSTTYTPPPVPGVSYHCTAPPWTPTMPVTID
ncbi:hypothetical protein H0E86_16105 [Streptomyces sp. SCSIO-PteL053]|nr:hypothetical protein H0E86_16105 [Streptomyces sp. SCSIO-PteL053]